MTLQKLRILALIAFLFFTSACAYIVLPEGLEDPGAMAKGAGVWSGIVTGVGQSEAGDLRVDLAIRNDTGEWSTMQAAEGQPATLTGADGKTSPCEVVFASTGGHRLAPGFQMRGYTTGKASEPVTQPLFVECQGVQADSAAGAKLSIPYISFNGILDDYNPEANKSEGTLELNLDEVVSDLAYPVAAPVDGLIQPAGTSFTGLSDNVVTLLDAQRTEDGLQFTWQNFNPTKFALKTHIGTPPVIGADGILYGVYQTLDMVDVPLTPANEKAEWTTDVTTAPDVKGFYILLSVESRKPRTYENYVVDISDK